jgi:hypothetical protein
MSKTTETIKATLNPTWDQTLIFQDVEIYGDPQKIAQYPPDVVLEFYDKDQVVGVIKVPSVTQVKDALCKNRSSISWLLES